MVLADEDAAEFAEMRMALHEDLHPESQLEVLLVNRIAAQQWRLARIPALEAELLDSLRDDLVLGDVGLGGAWAKDAEPYGGALMRLARYETMLERSVARLLAELRRAQADRRRHEREGLAQLVAERDTRARESPVERWRNEANGLSGPAGGGLAPLSPGEAEDPQEAGQGEAPTQAAPSPNEANDPGTPKGRPFPRHTPCRPPRASFDSCVRSFAALRGAAIGGSTLRAACR